MQKQSFWATLKAISQKPIGLIGLIFTASSLLIILPSIIVLTSFLKKDIEKYDAESILQHGKSTKAVVTSVNPMTNVNYNGENPLLIYYKYTENGTERADKFQTFQLDKALLLKPGSEVTIKYLDGQSVIDGLEPFVFPYGEFYLLPAMFLVIGLIFLSVVLLPILRKNTA